jgi:hypothetical protein
LYSAVAPPPSVAEAVAYIVEEVVGVVSYSKAVWFSIIDTPRGKNVASKIKKYKISPVAGESNDITYSTIQGFKGLENSVIMLVDIQTYNKPDLMYVGMSRARNVLYVFETKHAKSYRENL